MSSTPTRTVFLPTSSEKSAGDFIAASPEKILHLRKVLRLEWDSPIQVSDGRGKLFLARFVRKGEVAGAELDTLLHTEPVKPELELVLCLSKNPTTDAVVEKAVECQATSFIPVLSTRSVVKPKTDEIKKYLSRWNKIADSAMEQSENLWGMKVVEPQKWLPAFSKIPSFVFSTEGRLTQNVQTVFRALPKASPLRVMIGPEGGFTSDELSQLESAGFTRVSLGKTVLRVETAAVAAMILARFHQSSSV